MGVAPGERRHGGLDDEGCGDRAMVHVIGVLVDVERKHRRHPRTAVRQSMGR